MLQHGDATEEATVLTCCYSGMREHEICHLAWDDVDLEKNVHKIRFPSPAILQKMRSSQFNGWSFSLRPPQ